MISATAAKRLRWGRFDEESPYLSLPYGSPSDGQYFGPAAIGGPPGSRSGRGSYKSRNSPSEIVERLQQNLQNDTSPPEGNTEDSQSHGYVAAVSYNPKLDPMTMVQRFSQPNLRSMPKDDHYPHFTKAVSLNSICAYEDVPFTDDTGKIVFSRTGDRPMSTGLTDGQLASGCHPESGTLRKLSNNLVSGRSEGQHSSHNENSKKGYYTFPGNSLETPVLSVSLLPPPQLCLPEPTPHKFEDLKTLESEECRDAFLYYISYNCCYSEPPAGQLCVKHVKHVRILHYTLETFGEGRTTKLAYEPYIGGEVDGPNKGESPSPWSLICVPDIHFFNHTKTLEVPHTSNVKICFGCCGRGKVVCGPCNSSGEHVCTKCEGHRRRPGKIGVCSHCSGRGNVSCATCGSNGFVTCEVCTGTGQLRYYQQVAAVFTNHREDYAVEPEDLPDAVLRQLRPPLVFEQKLPQVWPLSTYPVTKIAEASQQMVTSHRTKFPSEKLLQQRQMLWVDTVCEVVADCQGKTIKYWIYGKDNRVHCPDYPRKYGICTIL